MPRPPLKRTLKNKTQGFWARSHPGKDTHPESTRTIDFPTRENLHQLDEDELEDLRKAARNASGNASSDSDHLVRQIHQASTNAALNETSTVRMHGALGESATVKASRKHRKSFESDATRRVRRSLQKYDVQKAALKPGEKLQQKATALRDKHAPGLKPTGGLGWTEDEVTASPGTSRQEQRHDSIDGSGSDIPASKKQIKAAKEDARKDAPMVTARDTSKDRTTSAAAQHRTAAPNVPATPSFLSIANFKRRPRQPSLLSQMQRVESRRNSISTAADVAGVETNAGEESILSLGDIPVPEAAAADEEPLRTSSSRKRKRDDPEIEVEASQSPGSSPPDGAFESPQAPNSADHVLNDESRVPSSQPTRPRPSTTSQRRSPSYDSPLPLPPPRKAQRTPSCPSRRSARSQPARLSSPINATSPLSTPPSSPAQTRRTPSTSVRSNPHAKQTRKSTKPKPETDKPLTSAQLTFFLPKRNARRQQRRKRDEFQILSTDDEDAQSEAEHDEGSGDELAASSRARAKEPKEKTALRASNANSKTPATSKRNAKSPAKSAAKTNGKAKKTYGRRSSAAFDVENAQEVSPGLSSEDEGDGVGVSAGGADAGKVGEGKSEELTKAKEKFAEVDDWEMSFESADIGAGGSSSPWR